MAKELNVPADAVRPWCMVGRQNGTIRPDIVLSAASLNMTMDEASVRYGHKQLLRMWIEETPVDADENPVWGDSQVELHRNGDKAILLFLKCFDPETQKLRGVGTFYASNGDKVQDIHKYIFPLLGWPIGTSYRVYEVSAFHRIGNR
jgi:ubiquitin carboxyl-terminal hydrolase 7